MIFDIGSSWQLAGPGKPGTTGTLIPSPTLSFTYRALASLLHTSLPPLSSHSGQLSVLCACPFGHLGWPLESPTEFLFPTGPGI